MIPDQERRSSVAKAEGSATHPFGLESGGQSGRTTRGLPPLCTVGAAEFAPPASGRTALFSTAIEFVVFSSPLPDVADPVVVQLVSGFSLEGVVDCAAAGPMTNVPTRIAVAARSIFISMTENRLLNSNLGRNVQSWLWFHCGNARQPRSGVLPLGSANVRSGSKAEVTRL